MLPIINDKTSTNINSFMFSPIRMHKTDTGEVFNIGVCISDGERTIFRKVPSFSAVEKCLGIENVRSYDFVLEQINDRYFNLNGSSRIYVSKSVFIDEPMPYRCKQNIEDAADVLFDKIMTIYSHKEHAANDRSSNAIVSHVKHVASKKFNDKIVFRKHIKEAFNKQIDTVVENDERNPVVLGEVCSPVVSSFHHDVATSIMALEMASALVSSMLLYMPAYNGLKPSVMDTYRYAMQTARTKGIHVIDTTDKDEFAGQIAEYASKAGVSLLKA